LAGEGGFDDENFEGAVLIFELVLSLVMWRKPCREEDGGRKRGAELTSRLRK
jgi:hypothetical protein